MRRLIPSLLVLLLSVGAGCVKRAPAPTTDVVPLPELRLSPASLGASANLTQRLSFSHAEDPGAPRTLDALLELDPTEVRLAGFVFHQRVFTLRWDGEDLDETRAPQVPRQLVAAHVLRDLQLAYWPAEVLREALPAGWTLAEEGDTRVLLLDDAPRVRIRYDGVPRWQGVTELEALAERYRLRIVSHVTEDG